MKLRFAVAGLVIALGAVGAAHGADDPITARRALMKQNGAAAKVAVDMVTGKTAFDADTAKAAMDKLVADMDVFPTLFPDGSDKGDTKASPDIWQNLDDLKAHAAKLADSAKAAGAAASDGLDEFKVAFNAVGDACKSCHQKYRLPSN